MLAKHVSGHPIFTCKLVCNSPISGPNMQVRL